MQPPRVRASNEHSGRFSHRRERVKLPLKVMTLDVAAPLSFVLDSDVAIFTITMAIELGPEVSHGDACC
jgi:hypothetical protein